MTFLTLPRRLALVALLALAGIPALAAPALAQAKPGRTEIEQIVKEYLLRNPEIIQQALIELEKRQREAEAEAVRKITTDPKGPLYVSEHHTIVGNPNGDVTIVEFSDYNCPYCKRGLADLQKILDTDKNVRVVLKEYPILSPGSREAAIVALALREQFDAAKLWKFHATLLPMRGPIGKDQAFAVAKDLGADMKRLETDIAAPKVAASLEESRLLADALGITGTPSYVVAEDLVVGARGYDVLAARIANFRKCRKAEC